MNAKDAIRAASEMILLVINKYIDDLSDADLLCRPGPGCNHLAWQLGHVIASNARLIDSICPGQGQKLPAGFAENHSKEMRESDDPAKFCSKQEYVDLLKGMEQSVNAALASVPEERLDEPSPEPFRSRFPTVGRLLTLIANHLLMHAGQFVVVRRQLGKPIVI
jgi:hypothetical protein